MKSKFYKEHPGDKIWWVVPDDIGTWAFSFDKKKIYNLFRDYPDAMTEEEVRTFNSENPYWAEFFKERL